MYESSPEEYSLRIILEGGEKRRLKKVEKWCKATHKCILIINRVDQITAEPGQTRLIINTWEEKFGTHIDEYEVGPFYKIGDFYSDVDPVKCRNSIVFKVEGPNDLRIDCKFKPLE